MAASVTVQDLLERNKQYSGSHVPFPSLREVAKQNNSLSIAMVSCVDSRVQPDKFFNLKLQDAFIFKTVAGHPQQCIQDLLVLDALSGSGLKQLVIMHHTDCGATMVTDEGIRAKLLHRLPEYKKEIDGMSFGAIKDLDESVKNDVAWIKGHHLIRKELAENTIGLQYDLKTGVVTEVDTQKTDNMAKSEL